MTFLEIAELRQAEADDDWNAGAWNAAAVGYLKSAEMLDKCGEAYATSATNMRQRSVDAIQRRDRKEAMKTRPAQWSGRRAIPVKGDRVRIYVNDLGCGTVTGHFTEEGYLGVIVKLDEPPKWWTKQNGADAPVHAFGIEIEPRA